MKCAICAIAKNENDYINEWCKYHLNLGFDEIYIFDNNKDMIKDNKSFTTQYRCYHDLKAQKVIKVYYKDFEKFFHRENHEI